MTELRPMVLNHCTPLSAAASNFLAVISPDLLDGEGPILSNGHGVSALFQLLYGYSLMFIPSAQVRRQAQRVYLTFPSSHRQRVENLRLEPKPAGF